MTSELQIKIKNKINDEYGGIERLERHLKFCSNFADPQDRFHWYDMIKYSRLLFEKNVPVEHDAIELKKLNLAAIKHFRSMELEKGCEMGHFLIAIKQILVDYASGVTPKTKRALSQQQMIAKINLLISGDENISALDRLLDDFDIMIKMTTGEERKVFRNLSLYFINLFKTDMGMDLYASIYKEYSDDTLKHLTRIVVDCDCDTCRNLIKFFEYQKKEISGVVRSGGRKFSQS